MKIAIGVVVSCILFVGPTYADDLTPSWVTNEKLEQLKTIGIDPESDLQVKGNYHWRFRTRKAVTIDAYSCPTGSIVAISRTIDLITPPEGSSCSGAKGDSFRALKLLPGGSAEPMP
jgi:hypothetical protein